MKQFAAGVLTAIMLFSVPVFASMPGSTEESSIESPQVVRKTKRTGRYVGRKSKKVGRRTWNGTRWVYSKSAQKTHSPRRKTWRTGRKVVSRTKKVFN
jgi:hypothetical protein